MQVQEKWAKNRGVAQRNQGLDVVRQLARVIRIMTSSHHMTHNVDTGAGSAVLRR